MVDGADVGAEEDVGAALGERVPAVALVRGRDGLAVADAVGCAAPVEVLEVPGPVEGVVVPAGRAVITWVTASSTRVAWASSS